MLQEAKIKKIKFTVSFVCLLCVLSLGAAVFAAYLNTNRDTRPVPEKTTNSETVSKNYKLLYETDDYAYYFRDDRDIIAVQDKKNDYVWKTGIDSPFKKQVEKAKDAVAEGKDEIEFFADRNNMTPAQVKELANEPIEDSMVSQYVAMANSLVTVEYYTGEGESMKVTRVSSAAEDDDEGFSNEIKAVGTDGKQWKLECIFELDDVELGVNVYITFSDDGKINYSVPYEEITGDGIKKIKNIILTPYLGASGGALQYYNDKTEEWGKAKAKPLTPGYVLVPDGSGALIRFTESIAKFTDYEGDVYGADPATAMYYYDSLDDTVPLKDPVMPVFGISHGDGTQGAFVAYADGGDEYMTINVTPSSTGKNELKYTFAYAAFKYNAEYFQVTNQAGDTYRKTQDTPNKFDIDLTYQFLSGDGSDGTPAADYTGMAQAYRTHLIENGTLTEVAADGSDIPMRIDFLMSDSKKGIFSTQQVTVTTTDDVKNILAKLNEDGIANINSGLIGWQSGGEVIAKPYSTSFSSAVGSESDFENLIKDSEKKGMDVSFSREFTTINETMISYYGDAASHINTKYLELGKSEILPSNAPVTEYGYATPDSSAEWLTDLYDDIGGYGKSFTIDGISNRLISTWENDGKGTSVTEAIDIFGKAISAIQEKGTKINLVSPNMYLWKYTDRFLQSPVGTSQYVYETDTVPFLQMVLHGTMEVYAPYSNFSFYSKSDMLKMIDYNISPSFVLTKKPSYLLAATASADYYSTEFAQYEEIIKNIYATVNEPLKQVMNYKWDSRTVLQDGVMANQYSKDGSVKTIVVNYTDEAVTVNGQTIEALSAKVLEGGVK